MEKEKINCQIRIEIATPKDLEVCKKLRLFAIKTEKAFGVNKKQIKKTEAKTQKEWQEFFFGEGMFTVLVWKESLPIGIGRVMRRIKKEDWFLCSGFILKEFRGQGIGKKMFKFRLDEIKRRGGGRKVRVGMSKKNKRSFHIAQTFGFKKLNKFKQLNVTNWRHLIYVFRSYMMELNLS